MAGMVRSVRIGEAVDRRDVLLDVGSDLDTGLAMSSVFFLPMPNSPRILVFFCSI